MAKGGVSASSINAWKACKRKFFYYKTLPFNTSLTFSFGLAFEDGVENLIKTGDKTASIDLALEKFKTGQGDINKIAYRDFEKKEELKGSDVKDPMYVRFITEKAEKEVEKCLELLPDMIVRCVDKLNELGIKFKDFQSIMTIFLENGISNEGRFDGIVEFEGKTYIFELKSYKNFKSKYDLQFDTQLLNYAKICRAKGFEIEGIIFCQNLKSKLDPPKVNKNGSLSVAKSQKVDPEEYWTKALEIYGSEEDVPDKVIEAYTEFMNNNKLIQIDILKFTDNQLDVFTNELNVVSSEMKKIMNTIKKDPKKAKDLCYPNYGNACNMCNHKLICREELLGKKEMI